MTKLHRFTDMFNHQFNDSFSYRFSDKLVVNRFSDKLVDRLSHMFSAMSQAALSSLTVLSNNHSLFCGSFGAIF